MIQGMVTNPYLGTGLVAGYRTSGESQRPGFAWFFGRDSMWTALALDAEGDFASTRKALEFVAKYQREDGKIPHEIAQGANFVNWFKAYPYAYASADATPLYIIAMNDYVPKAATPPSRRQNGTASGKRINSCFPRTTRRAFRRILDSATAGWKAARSCQ